MTRNIACPNCKEPSIGYWKKQFLGPARTIGCSRCGARISVSAIRFLPILGFILATAPILRTLDRLEYGFVSYAGAFVLFLLITVLYQHFFMPLVVRTRLPGE